MRSVRCLVALLLLAAVGSGQTAAPANDARAEAAATVNRYCVTCHNARARTAGLVLDATDLAQAGSSKFNANAEQWEKVLRQLRGGTMPPPGSTRPDGVVYTRVSNFLARELGANAAAHPNPGELSAARRLTRTEYRNAIRDVLALTDLPKEMDYATLLPADNNSSGFDNLADTLFVSPVAMERYMDAARKISRLAVGDAKQGPLVNIHLTPVRQPQEGRNDDLPFGTRGGIAVRGYFPQEGEYEFVVRTDGNSRDRHEVEVTVDGERKTLVPLSATFQDAEDGRGPKNPPLRFVVPAGPHTLGVSFIERSQALAESPLRPPGRSRGALPSIVSVTITGPFNPKGPGSTPSRDAIFACKPAGTADEAACARKILSNLARRAYRRPVSDSDVAPLVAFYDAARKEAGGDFDSGIQRGIERMLVSPQFLFRMERPAAGAVAGASYKISDLELATRLSFFLWSSVPDEALLEVAAAGRLRQPGVLEQQVQRMLADSRSEALVTNFAAQWLFLRDVEGKDPDLYLFRDFDEGLRAAFVKETELFLDSILRGKRSVLELLTANYTFLNERLAKHYGIPNVRGSHFRRIEVPAGSARSGLLGQGSILSLTAYATRTSAVLRGKYVLENLLASPPPPPPPNVPSLKTESSGDGKALTLREAMVQHRANPACAGCHARMDPIGFAMENFDAVGRWRDDDGGKPIDVESALPDGTKVVGVDGVRQLLLRRPEQFVEAMTSKLMMYALGRNVQYYDEPAVRAIAREAATKDNTFAALVTGVVNSLPFQTRVVRAAKAETRK